MQIPDNALAEYIRQLGTYAKTAEELESATISFVDRLIRIQQASTDGQGRDTYWAIEIDAYAKNVRAMVHNMLKSKFGKKTKIFEYVHYCAWNAYYLKLLDDGTIGMVARLKQSYETHNSKLLNANPEAMALVMDFIHNYDDVHGLDLLHKDLKLKGFFMLPTDVDAILAECQCDTIELMIGYYNFNYSALYFNEYVNLLAKRKGVELSAVAKKQVADLIALR